MQKIARLSKWAVTLFCAVLVGGILTVPVFADTTFTDNTFNLGNYTQTSTFLSNPATTLTVQQCAACGNPVLGLELVSTNPIASGSAVATSAVGLIGNLFTYNPSTQGAITSIDASVDKNLTVNFTNTGSVPLGNTFRPLIFQDGIVYLAAIAGPGIGTGQDTTGYNTLSQSGLTALNFLSYDFTTGTFGTANPNFNGDQMFFGLGQIFGATVPTETLTADYDNLSITLHTVPEPASFLMLGLGLAAVALIGRFRG
jgi:hypothetical protein